MTTLLISHPSSLRHVTPPGHPERADRMRAVEQALEDERFALLQRVEAPEGTLAQVELCHPAAYAQAISEASPQEGLVQIDADTIMSPGTLAAVLHGVGGAVHAVDEVMSGHVSNAFSAMRPPGHHAESDKAMGFCFFNNAAIAARHAQKAHGAERVAIVDWDVHHGNGTQEIFWGDASVLYASTHEMPLYPGTGAPSERGEHGTIVNAPLRAGDGTDVFRDAFESAILPRLDDFRPDLVIISAGFDAHWRDPLANINLKEADFAWATQKLMAIADRHAGGRLVSILEGGYDLEGLSKSTAAHVMALMRG
ncbi:histone deacetylase family protein [Bosea sp. (in: a-proteobacteria)]|uniref:histone deacetylase family protein n=1 Tax=Bosea sp. (in: a-proteobacteria) TaxID=1871050 RepID=UPI0025C3F23F|nr:histone deacetylase family protein [Bosea sp. (in: a-proteobacteria)]MBR3193581.1 histone deacetylase family protein [Bosea sp. (in: a-proteobacteria)]